MMQASKLLISNNYSALTCYMRQNVLKHIRAVNFSTTHQQRLNAEAPLTTPTAEGVPKIYPEKIQNIVSEITQLNILEVADLNELLKKTLNISDAPVMSFGAAMPAAAAQEEEEEEEEVGPAKVQTSFTVKMNKFNDAKKVAVIKEVKARLEGFNLVQAKKFVESCPAIVKADIPKVEAEELAEALNAAGAECIIE